MKLLPKQKNKVGRPKKSRGGRPTVMTEETLRLLRDAYLIDSTDEEACLYAQIGTTALYEYQKKNPQYAEQKKMWKQTPFLKARKAIVRNLDDPEFALKYMERKKKDEFALRHDITSDDEKIEGVIIYKPEKK